ncbi:MAG: alpha/beta fold hydrolase [Sporichthyaceae bacterium]
MVGRSVLRARGAKAAHEPDEDPYRVRHVVVHGYRRAFVMAGSGPAVLLLHGIGDSSETWRHLIAALAQDYTVIAPDLLGHGQSDRPRADYSVAAYACGMRDLLSVLDVETATVVGHSLGGGVAMQFAYQFPERCERLVLVATGGAGRRTNLMLKAVSVPGAGTVLPVLTTPGIKQVASTYIRMLKLTGIGIGRDAEDMIRLFDALPNRTARSAFIRTLRATVDRHGQVITMLDRCYLAAGMPTMLVWGDRDAVIPVDHGHRLHDAMPGSRLEIFRGAGHFPHHSDPDGFLDVLRHFLSTTPPARYSAREWRALLRSGAPPRSVSAEVEADNIATGT